MRKSGQMSILSEMRCDFETKSDVDLRTRGAGPYFGSKYFKPLILCYSINGAPIQTWTYNQDCPVDLRQHIESGGYIRAWNASFERQGFDWLAANRGWPRPAIDRYRCTAAEAAAMGLPRSLDDAGAALGVAIRKDKRGAALIRMFSIPRKAKKDEIDAGVLWHEPEDHPAEFEEFCSYCRQDIAAEGAIAARLMPLSDDEQRVYTLNQVINSRGLLIDRASCEAVIELVAKEKVKLDAEMREVTNGAVPVCSQIARLRSWVDKQGVILEGVAKDDILTALQLVDLPANVRRALELRQEAAKTSTAKLGAFLKRADADGRIRGAFLYHGASTGRESSLGVNFANMPRPRRVYEEAGLDSGVLFDAFRWADPDWLRMLYGPELGRPLHLVSDAIRGFVRAAPGHEFVTADYAGIEGAVIAWLAGEEWKLEALREILTNPELPDLYRRAAAAILGVTTEIITKKHPMRQALGKTSELALAYSGGVAAFVSMAKIYNIDLDSLYAPVWEAADVETQEKAVKRYERCLKARDKVKTDVLSREAWLASEIVKLKWRAANPAIVRFWRDIDDAMRDALLAPGTKHRAGKIEYLCAHNFLWARLPSGRCLAYGAPKLKGQVWACVQADDGTWPEESEIMTREQAEKLTAIGKARIEKEARPAVTALGVNSVSRKYERYSLYAGLAAENATQAVARDVLIAGMQNAEAHGYPIVFSVYDEAVAEVPRGFGSVEHFEKILCEMPPWANGLPLSASGWRGPRYKKA